MMDEVQHKNFLRNFILVSLLSHSLSTIEFLWDIVKMKMNAHHILK